MSQSEGERALRYWCSIWRGTDYFPGSVGEALLWAENEIIELRAGRTDDEACGGPSGQEMAG